MTSDWLAFSFFVFILFFAIFKIKARLVSLRAASVVSVHTDEDPETAEVASDFTSFSLRGLDDTARAFREERLRGLETGEVVVGWEVVSFSGEDISVPSVFEDLSDTSLSLGDELDLYIVILTFDLDFGDFEVRFDSFSDDFSFDGLLTRRKGVTDLPLDRLVINFGL